MPASHHYSASDSWNKMSPVAARVLAQVIFFILLGVLVFAPLAKGTVSPLTQGPVMIAIALASGLWIVALWMGRESQVVYTPIIAPVLVAATYVVVRYALAEVESVARPELLATVSATLMFFLMLNCIRHRWQITALVWTLVSVGVALGLLGFWQALRHTAGPARGTFAQPADYAVYLHFVFPVALAFFLFSRRSLNERVVFAFAGLIISGALALAQTPRHWGGWFAAVMVLAIYLLRKRGWKFRWLLIGAGLLAAVIAAAWLALGQLLPPVPGELSPAGATAIQSPTHSRILWRSALVLGQRQHLTGAGPGMFQWLHPLHNDFRGVTTAAGNEYLHLLADFGVVGAAIALWSVATFVIVILSLLSQRAGRYSVATPSNRFAFAIAGLAVLAAALVDAGLGCSLRAGANLLTLTGVLAAALTCGIHHRADPETKPPRFGQYSVLRVRGLPRFVLTAGLVVLVALLASRLYATFPSHFMLELAERKRINLRWAQAEIFYVRAWQLDSRNFATAEALGDLYTVRATWNTRQRDRLSADAQRWYDRAFTLNPYAFDILVKKSRLYDLAGNRDKAAELLQQALQAKPLDADYHAALGLHCQRWGDRTAARRHFQRAYELDPANPLPAHQLTILTPPTS